MKRSIPKPSDRKSKTDWNYVRNLPEDAHIPYDAEDGPYDPNDPAATRSYWDKARVVYKGKVIRKGRGPQKSPTKERITIRLSPEVVDYYRSSGEGWQTRMDEELQALVRRRKKRA